MASSGNVLPAVPPVLLAGTGASSTPDPGGGPSGGGVVTAGFYYDWAIAGVPFCLWPSEDDPYLRDTKEDVKDQFDASREPGEQSFGYWWLRSQASYHGGAGQLYLDTATDSADVSRTRFHSSTFIDPWTTGQASVSRGFTRNTTALRIAGELITWSSVRKLAVASTSVNTVVVYDIPDLTNPQTVTLGASGTCQAMTSDGERLFVAIGAGVYRIDTGGTATLIANVTLDGPVVMGYAKQRVIMAVGRKLFEIDPAPVTPPATPVAIYTNPAAGWRYTSVADGPNGIYVAGYSGPLSELALLSVTDEAGTLTLGAPVVQLRTPPDERINAVAFYLNAFFGLATSNGIRVGTFTPYGQPQYGPVLNPGNPIYSVSGSGSLLYFGGLDRIWSVDLGTQVANQRFAHVQYGSAIGASSTDTVTGLQVAVINGRDHLFGVLSSGGVLHQPATPVNTTGILTTSWARFSTVEPKRLHYLRIEGDFPEPLVGTAAAIVQIEAIDGTSQTFTISGGGQTSFELGVSNLLTAEAFRITFTLDAASVLRSWQLKARPAPEQFQELVLPLGCWDFEVGADGQHIGYPGYSAARLVMLEDAARTNTIVTAFDRWSNTNYRAQISRCQYRQSILPGSSGRGGGKVTLVLRVV